MASFDIIRFRIADIVYSIVSPDPALKLGIHGAIKNFIINETNPDVTIDARWDNLSEIVAMGKKIFDSGGVWQLYQTNGSYLFLFHSPVFGPSPYMIARVNKDFTMGEVLLHRPYFKSDELLYPLEYPLDELLFVNFLSLGRGTEIHSCGIIDSSGNGHLFFGQSGAGKTTMARLWQNESGVTILSDDRIILRRIENKICMYGTPWHGEAMLASPSRAPLTAVYFLEKGQKNELVAQKPSDSISHLFACSFPPFYNRDAIDFILGFLEGVVKAVPCYKLRFKPDKSVVELIQEAPCT
jgi:hypothetical protein